MTETHTVVSGERGAPAVSRARSLQSRLTSVLVSGLMMLVGVGMLIWYYTNALSSQHRAASPERTLLAKRVRGETPLPTFASLLIPASSQGGDSAPHPLREQSSDSTRAPESLPLTAMPPTLSPMEGLIAAPGSASSATRPADADGAKRDPAQVAMERRLSGSVFTNVAQAPGPGVRDSTNASVIPAATTDFTASSPALSQPQRDPPAPADSLSTLLRETRTQPGPAERLPTQTFLLGKGAFIDCTLETAVDSTLPGMTTCVTATDTFGVDGKVVLLERGTKLIGETRGQVQQGSARVFVLWTEARTPAGVVVPLDSPAADELGRAGLAGETDQHFWSRFGAAILISTLDGAVQAGVQSSSRGSGAVIYNPASSEGIVTEVLKSSVNIPPTVRKQNGDRIQVFVARDLDFRPVYRLRPR